MDREKFEDLKAAYVLRALTEDERRELEEYLADHPEHRTEVEDLASLANLIALSPAEHEPSPELRKNIMRVVESEATTSQTSEPSALARLREFVTFRKLALGAVAILAVALLSWNVLLQSEVSQLQGQLQQQERQTFALQGTGNASSAQAEVVTLDRGRSVLLTENMPSVPADRTFQIWVIKDGTPVSAGTFKPDSGTSAAAIEASLSGAEAVAITVEPAGGSDQPTSDPMLQTTIPS